MNRLKLLGFVVLLTAFLIAADAQEEAGPCEEDDFDIDEAQINYGKLIFNSLPFHIPYSTKIKSLPIMLATRSLQILLVYFKHEKVPLILGKIAKNGF